MKDDLTAPDTSHPDGVTPSLFVRDDQDGGSDRARRSVSQLTSFARCGEAYRLERIEKAPRMPAAWFAQGVAVHSAIEYYERWRCSEPDGVDREAIFTRYYSEYDRLIDEERQREPDLAAWLTGGRVRAEDDIVRRRERGADMLYRYILYAENAPERPLDLGGGEAAVEVPFEIELGGVAVVGAIDMILVWPDGSLTPRDIKSGSKRPEWYFQLGVYALAIEDLFGVRPEYGDFYMLKDEKPDRPVPLRHYTPEIVGEWFRALDSAVQARAFVPNPGDHCRTCGVKPFCSAMGGLLADQYAPTLS